MSQIRGEQIQYFTIGQVTSDPVSPRPGQTWVLKTDRTGSPMGLLLAMTYPGPATYQLSYQTFDGNTVRSTLS